jgi:hypothetical protein
MKVYFIPKIDLLSFWNTVCESVILSYSSSFSCDFIFMTYYGSIRTFKPHIFYYRHCYLPIQISIFAENYVPLVTQTTTVHSFHVFFQALNQHLNIKTIEWQVIRGLAIFIYWEVPWICYPPTYRNWVQILRFWYLNSENWDGGHEQLISNGGRFKPCFCHKR